MLRKDAPAARYFVRSLTLFAWLALLAGCGDSKPAQVTTFPESPGRESTEVASDQPIVELRTNMGTIKLQLDIKRAPETVENFLTYVERHEYDGTIFHQVDQGYALVGGGFTPELLERTGHFPIRNEAANGLTNKRGTISMARILDKINSATCQFVINLVDNPGLDHVGDKPDEFGFCVFGRVIEGLDVIDRIAATPVQQTERFTSLPRQAVVIESAKRLR